MLPNWTNAVGLISAACNDSWKVDETSIKVKKVWMYLYRAVDSEGNTLEFLLSATRDGEAAKRFFAKALHSTACSAPGARPVEEQVAQLTTATDPKPTRSVPRVINVDKYAAYPKAMTDLKASGVLHKQVELRQVKYLNNLVEQDHRFIKRMVKPEMGFFSLETAGRTLQGYARDEHDSQRAGTRRGERRHHGPGHLHRQPV